MRNITTIIIFLFGLFSMISNAAFSQSDKIMRICESYISYPYVSDGQDYCTILKNQEIAEFNVVFYGGGSYRVAACSGEEDGRLTFSIYDRDRNLLFTNKDYDNAPYWDFKVKNTVNLIIEAELVEQENNSGFAILEIGFKQ